MSQRLLIIFACFCTIAQVFSSPRDDLGSPSQETRDAAAKILRESYVPPPRARWEPLLSSIKIGDSRKKVLELLRPFNATPERWVFSGGSSTGNYRLDDLWLLECSFNDADDTLFEYKLWENLRYVWVDPPPGFTGIWTTYYANGQRSHEMHYANGEYSEGFTTFLTNGSKCSVDHYGAKGIEGEVTVLSPSGNVISRGQYKAGKPVGTWTWYNEDGSIKSTQEHGLP